MNHCFNKWVKISWLLIIGISIVLIIGAACIKDLEVIETYYYIDYRIVARSWHNVFSLICNSLIILVILICFITIGYLIIQKKQEKVRIVKKVVITNILTLFSIFFIMMADLTVCGFGREAYEPQYYQFTDGAHTIVIAESSFLLAGFGEIFQVQENSKAYLIGEFTTDDGFRNQGNYRVEWYREGARIYYDNGTGSQASLNEVYVNFIG